VERQLISSGSQYEQAIGLSRAVRVGSWIAVAGTAPIAPDVSRFIDPAWLVETEADCYVI